MAISWPLVERDRELTQIRQALSTPGRPRGVVLSGPAGVGKTTLVRHATSSVRGEIRWVAGTESARSIPLGVFAQFVSASTTRDPVTLLSSAREALIATGAVVLGVDDGHLLDGLSAALLHQLAIDNAASIVVTVRSGEDVPDAVTSLWKDGYLGHLELAPFTREQTIDLVESVIGGQLEGLSADLIWQASRGNALFLRHLVEGAIEAGTLRQVSGIWQLRGRTAVTSELALLLDGRITQLPDAVVHVLRILTLCEPLDLDVLTEIADVEAIDDAEYRGLIQISSDGTELSVRFSHPLFGDVVRRRLGVASARRLRGTIAAVLQQRGTATASERVRLAELAHDSDRPAQLELLDAAASDAIALANLPLAERFARAAVRQNPGIESVDMLARALLWQGKPDEVERLLAGFDPRTLNPIQLVRWGSTRAANLLFSMGDSEQADELLALVRSRVDVPALQLVVDGVESAFALHENRLEDAVAAANRVFESPKALPWAIEWAAFGGGRALALMGRGSEVPDVVAKMRAVEDKCDGLLRFPAVLADVQALTLMGNLTEAAALAGQYYQYSEGGLIHAWALANTLTATVEVDQGKFATAVSRLEQSLAAFPDEKASAWSFPARVLLAQTYSALGRTSDAASAIAEADAKGGRHAAVFGPQLHIARAWHAAAEGMVGKAIGLARTAAEAASASHQYAIEGEALHAAARFGDHTVATRLAELATMVDGTRIDIHARHAEALAKGCPDTLDAVAVEYESMGALLSAADAAAQAANVHDAAGNRRRTVDAAGQASRLAALCGGAVTPAIRSSAQPLPITLREREVANLVAAGLSNKQIAERLVVSVRTVEGHIYRTCTKLDVTDREALALLILGTDHES